MILWHDLYTVLTAVIPLYVAMILAYGSVRWWKIFSPDQCSGINRFVAIFAVPLLSFHFISTNNPYAMNLRFIAADTLQKVLMLALLVLWANLTRSGSLEWSITIFSLSTLPNTLVMGIPLLIAMYGEYAGSLMVQVVVLQCIIWYTLLLFLFEFRGAKMLIMEQFPETAASIVSFKVESDVVSLDGHDFLETDTEIGDDGKLHVTVRKSNDSRRSFCGTNMTPRPSNLTGAEIYSLSTTPTGSNFNHSDFYSMMGFPGGRLSNFGPADMYPMQSSRGPTPRPSNFDENCAMASSPRFGYYPGGGSYPAPNPEFSTTTNISSKNPKDTTTKAGGKANNHDASVKELHMFLWSSNGSPVSDKAGLNVLLEPLIRVQTQNKAEDPIKVPKRSACLGGQASHGKNMPPASVMTRLILIMVWRKLIRNPNTYSSLIGGTWQCQKSYSNLSLFYLMLVLEWQCSVWIVPYTNPFPITIEGPKEKPRRIARTNTHQEVAQVASTEAAGNGSGAPWSRLFMALQPKLIACGNSVATFAMAVRFLTGPAVMAVASIIIGLHALPQGIVPFVFAKEYNVHPAILSTGVIFGMLIALPITLVYYILLGL
ncbi:hypothetical protein F2Q69_00020491 [Brassica cretica]|uniref:Auxin efflux carrier component n=1 Tax=Brassica cretica TaxID=69181 RepID=A0A8S9Q6I3_BRACR|nr:hypothetical protein F2Q69_00020491 [Brassica cretica]